MREWMKGIDEALFPIMLIVGIIFYVWFLSFAIPAVANAAEIVTLEPGQADTSIVPNFGERYADWVWTRPDRANLRPDPATRPYDTMISRAVEADTNRTVWSKCPRCDWPQAIEAPRYECKKPFKHNLRDHIKYNYGVTCTHPECAPESDECVKCGHRTNHTSECGNCRYMGSINGEDRWGRWDYLYQGDRPTQCLCTNNFVCSGAPKKIYAPQPCDHDWLHEKCIWCRKIMKESAPESGIDSLPTQFLTLKDFKATAYSGQVASEYWSNWDIATTMTIEEFRDSVYTRTHPECAPEPASITMTFLHNDTALYIRGQSGNWYKATEELDRLVWLKTDEIKGDRSNACIEINRHEGTTGIYVYSPVQGLKVRGYDMPPIESKPCKRCGRK